MNQNAIFLEPNSHTTVGICEIGNGKFYVAVTNPKSGFNDTKEFVSFYPDCFRLTCKDALDFLGNIFGKRKFKNLSNAYLYRHASGLWFEEWANMELENELMSK